MLEYWVLDPEHLAHRFYGRKGELLVEFATGQDLIEARTLTGFWLKRSWLNPEQLPIRNSPGTGRKASSLPRRRVGRAQATVTTALITPVSGLSHAGNTAGTSSSAA